MLGFFLEKVMPVRIILKFEELHTFSRLVMAGGALLSVTLYILGGVCGRMAAGNWDYLTLCAIHGACAELAPALFAACFCAALLCDLILRDKT